MRRGSTPRGRGQGAGRRGGGQSNRLRGLFDKIWYCDCAPRQPAEHFKVKKEGRNQGRFFYTCQQDADKRCGFFLWAEEAKAREATCVLNNSHGEKPQDSRSTAHPEVHFADLPTASPTSTFHAGVKRKPEDAGFADDDDDDYDEAWNLTGAEEQRLAEAAEASLQQTPQRDYTLSSGPYITPTSEAKRSPRKLPWLQDQDPTTPQKSISDFFNQTPTMKRVRMLSPEETPVQQQKEETIPVESDSPSPSTRFKDVLQSPGERERDRELTITEEVLSELGLLPAEKLARLKVILRKHESKAQGFKKGRDVSRAALKTSQAQLVEAREKIAGLEAERSRRRVESRAGQSMMRNGNGNVNAVEDEETDDEL